MVVVCLPVWAWWDVVMLAGSCAGAESFRSAPGCLPRPEGLLCSGGGGERVACEGMWGRRLALPWPEGLLCSGGGGGGVAVREVLRGGQAVWPWRGGGGAGDGFGHLCDESVVSRSFVPGGACRCVGGVVAESGISSAFGFASRLLKLLSVAGFSPCRGHRMGCGATERSDFRLGVSAHCFIVCVPVSRGVVAVHRCGARRFPSVR